MNVSQYDQRFTQLSRYANGLVKIEVEETKRFVKDLKLEIRGKLIPLQLRKYLQEDWAKGLSVSKRPRYQGPSGSGASGSTINKGSGFNATLEDGSGAGDHG